MENEKTFDALEKDAGKIIKESNELRKTFDEKTIITILLIIGIGGSVAGNCLDFILKTVFTGDHFNWSEMKYSLNMVFIFTLSVSIYGLILSTKGLLKSRKSIKEFHGIIKQMRKIAEQQEGKSKP